MSGFRTLDAAILGVLIAGAWMPVQAQSAQPAAVSTAQSAPAARGRYSLDLPNGGLIWATEDPTLTSPLLNVQGSAVAAFERGQVTEPVRFQVYSNYDAFIRKMQISIYRGDDTHLTAPLATVDVAPGAVVQASWDGKLPAGTSLQAGQQLSYVLRAWGEDGSIDETYPRTLQLVRPEDRQRSLEQRRQGATGALCAVAL